MDTQNVVDTVIEQFEDLVDFDSQGMIDYYVDESWDQLRQNERRQGGFRERHRREWGDALDLLGRIHFLSMEVGRRFNGKCRDNEANGPTPELFDALTRLHGRMCLVSSEIKTLLESGHASGAQARWRTLYETLAIMLFIAQDGNETAERYLLHELITSAEAVDEYSKYREELGLEPLEEKARKELKEDYENLKSKYEGVFATNYGWAAEALEERGIDHGGRPRLHQIAEVVGLDHLRPYYRLSNYSIHAGAKAIKFNLGLVEETDRILSGPSNYGLADPASCTALALEHSLLPLLFYGVSRVSKGNEVSETLISETLEVAFAVKSIWKLSDQCQEEFHRVQEDIEKREKRLREKESRMWEKLDDLDFELPSSL